jgi:hypothetical protein
MFYIISSRIPIISSDKTNRKYFKLFVSGAVSYVLLHYYLNKEVRNGMVEKIRKYIYYVMIVDFAIACILLKYIKTNVPELEDDEDDEIDNNSKNSKNINNPQKLSKELEEQRRLFLEEHQRKILQERLLQQKAQEMKERELKEIKEKETKKDKTDKTDSESKKTEETETESKKTESVKKQKKKTKKEVKKNEKIEEETNVTDTEIPLPIYNN